MVGQIHLTSAFVAIAAGAVVLSMRPKGGRWHRRVGWTYLIAMLVMNGTALSIYRLYGVTRAGFYAWQSRPVSAHMEQDRRLATAISTLFTVHGERYGSPRIHHALTEGGWVVSRRRVARLMRAAGLRAKAVRGYRAKTGVNRFFAQHPNRLRGRTTTGANQIWVGDITYLAIAGHWYYLAVIMDYHSRRVLAWSLGRRRDTRVTRALFQAAVRRRQPVPGWLFHSDRGVEYLGAVFCACVAAAGCVQSASERGPGDNARMESFFHSMKAEAIRGLQFATVAELRTHLRRYFRYYNHTRVHSALGYCSPVAFERRAA